MLANNKIKKIFQKYLQFKQTIFFSDKKISVFYINDMKETPHDSLSEIWVRIKSIFNYFFILNQDEKKIREMFYKILLTNKLAIPSIFSDKEIFSTESFAFRHLIYYRCLEMDQEYFWITSLLDRCYSLSTLYFPQMKIALTLYPYQISSQTLQDFEQMRTQFFPSNEPQLNLQIRTVLGFPHMMHMLWNELPAIDKAIQENLTSKIHLIATYQPFGPLKDLFPELNNNIDFLSLDETFFIKDKVRMFTSIGSWRINKSTQSRIKSVARNYLSNEILSSIKEFKNKHYPIFWISVKPPPRTVFQQSKVLSNIISLLKSHYPQAGFLLNGCSYPWDLHTNQNYDKQFRKMLDLANLNSQKIIEMIYRDLSVETLQSVKTISDVMLLEEIEWGGIANFYFCHGGTMQNKIGWLHDIPGIIHSNLKFILGYKGMQPPVEDSKRCHFLPKELILDDDVNNYTEFQLERKDQNYQIVSAPLTAQFIIDTFNQTLVE